VGEYPVTLRASNSGGSFIFDFVLKVKEKVYYLDIPLSFVGGKVTAKSSNENPFLAYEGETVTLTIAPDAGYELSSITVYHYGTETTIPLSGTGLTRTFKMPAGHITVVAVFKLIGVAVEDIGDAGDIRAYVENGVLYVSGLSSSMSQKTLRVHAILGTLVYQGAIAGDKAEIALPGRGIYIVTDGTKVLKIVY